MYILFYILFHCGKEYNLREYSSLCCKVGHVGLSKCLNILTGASMWEDTLLPGDRDCGQTPHIPCWPLQSVLVNWQSWSTRLSRCNPKKAIIIIIMSLTSWPTNKRSTCCSFPTTTDSSEAQLTVRLLLLGPSHLHLVFHTVSLNLLLGAMRKTTHFQSGIYLWTRHVKVAAS